MSTIPSIETILLNIHQSLGCAPYQTRPKSKFAMGQMRISNHKEMLEELFESIFDVLDINPRAREDILFNLTDLDSFNKGVELQTWTFDADQRQILWMILGYSYIPGIARISAFWNLEESLDKGMPGGRFWYLPEIIELDGQTSIYLPVTQVVDWLLDMLGMPMEEFIDMRSQSIVDSEDMSSEALMRSLYHWRKSTLPKPTSFINYFPDEMQVPFKGALPSISELSADEQFNAVMEFIEQKQLTASNLRQEIPMTQPGLLEDILKGSASDDLKRAFVTLIKERYTAPSPKIIRQRLLFARMVQDGYTRLLKTLLPGIDPLCADAEQNKLLQLVNIYKLIYNLTIDAWRNCRDLGEDAENVWFEENLPVADKHRLYLSILPSRRDIACEGLSMFLTRYFDEVEPGAALEDHIGLDEDSAKRILLRNEKRDRAFADELKSELHLVERIKTSSPWRALQNEHRYWVVSQVAQNPELSPKAKTIAIKRLYELAENPEQTVGCILLELDYYLNSDQKDRSRDAYIRVQQLLEQAESNSAYNTWEAPIVQYKAKHLLSCNDFDGAGKLFREALNVVNHRGYGPLRGEVARDCLAVETANQKLIINNHEKYYREMLTGGMMMDADDKPSIEDTARWASEYFWSSLYKPYAGIEALKPRAEETSRKMIKALLPLFESGDMNGVITWIEANRNILKSNLPDVRGDSVLMLWIKLYKPFLTSSTFKKHAIAANKQEDNLRFENMLANWRKGLELIAQSATQQLNIVDFKGQTPLMLMAEAGDTQMVKLLLRSGADPEKQDYHGMTALHSAVKSHVDSCVDALLDHPCRIDKVTIDAQTVLHTAAWTANIYAAKRLISMAPELAWMRNTIGFTPLEYVEFLLEEPQALEMLARELRKNGRSSPSNDQFQQIVSVLEQAPLKIGS